MTRKSGALLQGTVDMLVLKTLHEEPMHGYGVSRVIAERTDGVVGLDDAALYQALHRLAAKGYVEAEWGVSENNRRAKYYRLTRKGKKQLGDAAAEWRRYADAVLKVLGP
ncbi:MAG: PadR family transcriptional regulator [Acidobacteriota bacterium]|jgi:transcriptional regulator